MKRMIFCFLVVFFSILNSGCAAEQALQKGLKADESINDPLAWDFGKIKQGDLAEHAFVFRNQAQKTINIRNVTTSCGCTASQAKKKELKPGESTDIEVTFKSKEYSGLVQQFIYVNTDDLDNPVTRFIIKADVIK